LGIRVAAIDAFFLFGEGASKQLSARLTDSDPTQEAADPRRGTYSEDVASFEKSRVLSSALIA
jgi:hypothetical protein